MSSHPKRRIVSLCRWYWYESDLQIANSLKDIIDKIDREQGIVISKVHFTNWPPRFEKLDFVEAKWSFPTGGTTYNLDISPNGKYIITSSSDGNIYLLDTGGHMVSRFKTPSKCLQALFISKNRIAICGQYGNIFFLSVTPDGRRYPARLQVDKELRFCEDIDDKFAYPIHIAHNYKAQHILASYGNLKKSTGGIALLTSQGQLIWNKKTDFFIRYSCFSKVVSGTSGNKKPLGLSVGLKAKDNFTLSILYESGDIKDILSGPVIMHVGYSMELGLHLISYSKDKVNFELLVISAEGERVLMLPTKGFACKAAFLEQSGKIIASCTPFKSEKSDGHVMVWDTTGKILWEQQFPGHVWMLGILVEWEIGFISSRGQGNIYSLTLDGQFLRCAETLFMPVCASFIVDQNLCVIGSEAVNGFILSNLIGEKCVSSTSKVKAIGFWLD